MDADSEQLLTNDLLANEYFKIDWQSILSQPETANWCIPQQVSQKIFEGFLRYSAADVKKIICFFALNPQEQIEILPSLEKETKFDFSDGDWITDKSLSVLVNLYMDMINCLSIRLMILDLEEQLIILDSTLSDIFNWIDIQEWDNEDFWKKESLWQSEWQFIRKLSRFIKQYLQIKTTVTQACLEKIITDCLHS